MNLEQHEKSGSSHESLSSLDNSRCCSFIVALTGGIGSGKSTVATCFAQLNVPVVDADIIARLVVAPGMPARDKIVQHFGPESLLADGQLDRAYLRHQIFQQPDERVWLNRLLHPLIRQETRRQIEQINAPYLLWVVPLLVENRHDYIEQNYANSNHINSNYTNPNHANPNYVSQTQCRQIQPDRILVVDVSREMQIARVLSRDVSERQQVEKILATQATRQERRAYADDIIDNSGSLQHITPQVAVLHQHYLQMAHQKRRAR